MKQNTMVQTVQSMIAAQSCYEGLKKVGQAWLDAVGNGCGSCCVGGIGKGSESRYYYRGSADCLYCFAGRHRFVRQ